MTDKPKCQQCDEPLEKEILDQELWWFCPACNCYRMEVETSSPESKQCPWK